MRWAYAILHHAICLISLGSWNIENKSNQEHPRGSIIGSQVLHQDDLNSMPHNGLNTPNYHCTCVWHFLIAKKKDKTIHNWTYFYCQPKSLVRSSIMIFTCNLHACTHVIKLDCSVARNCKFMYPLVALNQHTGVNRTDKQFIYSGCIIFRVYLFSRSAEPNAICVYNNLLYKHWMRHIYYKYFN